MSLTFDEGSVSGDKQCYQVVIIDDDLVEGNENFTVTLTSPEPALLGSILSRATVTINPDPADGMDNIEYIIKWEGECPTPYSAVV